MSVAGLQKLVERAGIEAKLPFKVHPHMLRHATGFALANKGTDTRTLQAYLGHRSIQSQCVTPSWRQAGSRTCGGEAERFALPLRWGAGPKLSFEEFCRPPSHNFFEILTPSH